MRERQNTVLGKGGKERKPSVGQKIKIGCNCKRKTAKRKFSMKGKDGIKTKPSIGERRQSQNPIFWKDGRESKPYIWERRQRVKTPEG